MHCARVHDPWRRGARSGRAKERDQTAEQHALTAVEVAESASGEQADRHREAVGRRDPLDHRVRPTEVTADRGSCHLGDRGIKEIHGGCGDGRREGQPAQSAAGG